MSEEQASNWIEVVVPTSVALADGVAQHLVETVSGAKDGVVVRKAEVVFWVDMKELEESLAEVRASLRTLQGEGWAVQPDQVRSGSMAPEEDWRDAWKQYFHVTRLTRQFVVVPSWEEYEPQAEDIIIKLDPGKAFGTGAHGSTQLVLEEMQALVDAGHPAPATLFDLGTGSGILAIAAAKLWPKTRIIATDIDPMSIDATRENAEDNGVHEQIEVSTTDLSEVPGRYPLVLANLQSHILRSLRDDLCPKVAPGGLLLVSGILTTQIQSLVENFQEVEGIVCKSIRRSELDPQWSSAVLARE